MVSVIAVVSMLFLTAAAVSLLRRGRRRNGNVSHLENVSVSRQWLMQHQADDRS